MIRKNVIAYMLCVTLAALYSLQLSSQNKKYSFFCKKKAVPVVTDTTKKPETSNLKSYAAVIPATAKTQKGMIDIHVVKNDYFFEIPVELLGRDFLVVNKISKVPEKLNDAGINKGMNYENQIINFEIDTLGGKVFIRRNNGNVGVPHADEIAQSVKDNFLSPIIDYFKIETFGKGKRTVVINVNKVFDGSNNSVNNVFDNVGMNGITPIKDLSRIIQGKTFPKNMVVKSELTAKVTGVSVTVETTTNLVLLDQRPMTPRFEDRRVGYFSTPRWYFNDEQHKLEQRKLITRWRLEPKKEDIEKYKRGELVEPQKPIIYYVDASTPKKWRQAIIDGINDWQKAFESAGFKNAIVGKEPPANDPDFDPDDVRYSVVTYAASEKANAMGPSVVDPRSGEIIEADVIWWHNVMSVLTAWIRIQTAAIDPRARTPKLSDELMAHAIRFVSSHEVGHTLGLPHNMGSSYAFPVDSLRSSSFTSKMGGTAPSIMDYARFNYIAQPGDGVTQITPVIGLYDLYAINWGYRYTGFATPHDELPVLNKWIVQHENEPLYRFGEQQSTRDAIDPSAQSEDLGNDNIKASKYGIANLKRIVPNILTWTYEEGKNYEQAGKMLNGVIGQWNQYAYHVLTNIGGIYIVPTVYGQKTNTFTHVPKAIQQNAVKYLVDEVFTTPEWLFKNDIYKKSYPLKESPVGDQEYSSVMYLKNIQSFIYYDLVKDERLSRMLENEAVNGDKAYKVTDLLDDLYKSIFQKTTQRKKLDVYERNMQKGYIDALIVSIDKSAELPANKKSLLDGIHNALPCMHEEHSHAAHHADDKMARNILFYETKRVSDAISAKRGTLNRILVLLQQKKNNPDVATRYHYEDLILRIKQALNKE